MSQEIILACLLGYFLMLMGISFLTSRKANNRDFFIANKSSPWYLVAFGMIGASLSGVTFLSVPGWVATNQFSYIQLVMGNLVGYLVIGLVLLPLYYRLNLTTIYTYLDKRFGIFSYKTGAFFFLLSRTIGSAFRLFLVASVIHIAIFRDWDVPYYISVLLTLLLIWLYTFRGGIKTIVWTDTLQTALMLLAVYLSISYIAENLGLSVGDALVAVKESDYSTMFIWDPQSPRFFPREFFAGIFIAIVMTGLDQDMMQKHLTCRNIGDAQKNIFSFSIVFFIVNMFFLSLGALLYIFAAHNNIETPTRTDELFPMLALNYFTPFASLVFVLGLIAAAYSSADSAMTALTTSFCVDFLGFERENFRYQEHTKTIRYAVHFGFLLLLFLLILLFNAINNDAVVSNVFTAAGYTYGPLLGLFAFGLLTKLKVRDIWVPLICVLSPVLSYIINLNSEELIGYKFGFEILILNGFLTFMGLLLISRRNV